VQGVEDFVAQGAAREGFCEHHIVYYI
jgi:hypothetical protein